MVSQTKFDERFLDKHAGKIITDPVTAIIELVANCWDAGATKVEINWPNESDKERSFFISDNGSGLTYSEIELRWLTLDYNRQLVQGSYAEFPSGVDLPKRQVFGRNGRGRYAAFCFSPSSEYIIESIKEGKIYISKIKRGLSEPVSLELISESPHKGSGTKIIINDFNYLSIYPKLVRIEIGKRFLMDPNFEVLVNNEKVVFEDIPQDCLKKIDIDVPNFGKVELYLIDAKKSDKNTKQHGVAWRVMGRLVGKCDWGDKYQKYLDGRKEEAKRYTFIINADILSNSVKADWSGFIKDDSTWLAVEKEVHDNILKCIENISKPEREATLASIENQNIDSLKKMSYLSREKWNTFIEKSLYECPSINERHLSQLAGILAGLENSSSKYGLLEQLHVLQSKDFDNLSEILEKWTLGMAKIVLDELEGRLKLISELESKISNRDVLEVQELQPLFAKGLWIFGHEFESIEFTSNKGMTTVVQDLFNKKDLKGSLNRPDFVIIPESTIGLYSLPSYDDDFNENGIDKVVIVELKSPSVKVGSEEKNQAWKYVKELYSKGCLQESYTKVICYVLGTDLDHLESKERMEQGDKVRIIPFRYDTILSRAKTRTLKLYDKVKDAPYLKNNFTLSKQQYIDFK